MLKRALAFSVKCGASKHTVIQRRSMGRLQIVGFRFKTPPGPDDKLWKPMKGMPADCYCPRGKGRHRTDLQETFDTFVSDAQHQMKKLLLGKKAMSFIVIDGGFCSAG